MELSQLRYFKTVAEMEHFTRAAETLHIAQPSLSKAISNLESELGVELFERTKRTVYLNDYGRTFLKRVDKILTEVEEAQAEIHDMATGMSGDIRIASTSVFSEPSAIHAYMDRFFLSHPYIGLHSYTLMDTQIRSLLQDRQIDFGITMQPSTEPEIESVLLLHFQLGVVVSSDHPLADRGEISLQDLKNDCFMCNNTSIEMKDSLYELCHKAGFHPHVIFEGESSSLIGKAVERGIGVAFVSEERHDWQEDKYPWEKNIRFLRVKEDFCVRNVYLWSLRDRYLSPAAREFQEELLKFVKEYNHEDMTDPA